MKNIILKYALKVSILTFALATVALGVLAFHLTHVHASITITFGDPLPERVAMADIVDMNQMIPLPQHKPSQGHK